MKNILYLTLFLVTALSLGACQEKAWTTDELEYSEVWRVTIDPSAPLIYYYYPEKDYYIVENRNSLDVCDIHSWVKSENDENIEISLTANIGNGQEVAHSLIYQKEAREGVLIIEVLDENDKPTVGQTQEHRVRKLEKTAMLVEKN